MNNDKRVERNRLSVLSLQRLLSDIINDPISYSSNELLQKALCSQGALSKHSDNARNICPSSINTLKRIADSIVDGGFKSIDSLRIQAAQAIENSKSRDIAHRKTSKLHLIGKVEELKSENLILKESLHLLTHAFHKAITQGASYAISSDKPEILDICRKEQKQLLISLSLIKTPIGNNVVNIYEK